MKNTIKIAFAIVFTMFVGVAVNAQTNTNAVVNFSGTISPSVDMRIAGITNNSTGTSVTGTSATQATINFGELSPNRNQNTLTNGHSAFTVNVELRSNTAYRVQANSDLGSTVGTSAWELDDIGFGVLPASNSGDGAAVFSGASNISVGANASSADPAAAAPVNGVPSYAKTLSDIKENSDIITGSRISYQGNVTTPNNAIIVPLRFASAPQFFDPATRTGSVVFDIFVAP